MEADEGVKREIGEAFAGVEYPGDNKLVYDNTGAHLECAEVAEAFRGKHWKEVTLDLLRDQSAAVFFMTPEAYRFYLPAYLLASIDSHDEMDTMPGSLVFSLTPPVEPSELEAFRKRTSRFNTAEARAIHRFLEHLRDAHAEDFPDAQVSRALRFWESWTASSSAATDERRSRNSRGGWVLILVGALCFIAMALTALSNGFVGEIAAGPVTIGVPRWALPMLGSLLLVCGVILVIGRKGRVVGGGQFP